MIFILHIDSLKSFEEKWIRLKQLNNNDNIFLDIIGQFSDSRSFRFNVYLNTSAADDVDDDAVSQSSSSHWLVQQT